MTRKASIFLVEDEAIVRMDLAAMLEELGHRIGGEAGNIKDAIDYAYTGTFDLAILDINIGGLGIDPVADILERRGVPFLFVTGYGSLIRRRLVLAKPVSKETLGPAINSLIKRDRD